MKQYGLLGIMNCFHYSKKLFIHYILVPGRQVPFLVREGLGPQGPYSNYAYVRNLRTRPSHLTTYWLNIMGLFNLTLIDRVNKIMTKNIRSTYDCHTFLEVSGQVHQTIYRVNIWGYFDSAPKYRVNQVLFWPHIQIGLRYLYSVSRDSYAWGYWHQFSLSWSYSFVS